MSLVECRECHQTVSKEAVTCPHCGIPAPDKTLAAHKRKSPISGLLLGFVFGPLGVLYSTNKGAAIMFVAEICLATLMASRFTYILIIVMPLLAWAVFLSIFPWGVCLMLGWIGLSSFGKDPVALEILGSLFWFVLLILVPCAIIAWRAARSYNRQFGDISQTGVVQK